LPEVLGLKGSNHVIASELALSVKVVIRRACELTVFGTTSAKSSKTILPAGLPPIVMSKNTRGFEDEGVVVGAESRDMVGEMGVVMR
jgi:hypothetical protein